jgi:hypothetical protein
LWSACWFVQVWGVPDWLIQRLRATTSSKSGENCLPCYVQ